MRNSTKYISMFMVVLSILVLAVQRRGICSPASPDSCDLKTYVFYTDTIVEDAFTNGPANLARLGNFFPIADYTSGVIKSLDMCFSSNSSSSAQSCTVYFYKADQTTIFGQSDPFINTGAPWPDYTCFNVTCPDIPYTGPFYAMVDYTIDTMPFKNFFCITCEGAPIPGYPLGVGFYDVNGVWTLAANQDNCTATFLQSAYVCENDAVGIIKLSPGSISLYPNPANDFVNIVSRNDIKTIEILNYTGQIIYKTNDVNLKGIRLDVSSFRAGEYVVKITTVNGFKTTKITVIH